MDEEEYLDGHDFLPMTDDDPRAHEGDLYEIDGEPVRLIRLGRRWWFEYVNAD